MDATSQAYETLLTRFVAWAQDQPDLRAALVVGSRARRDHPADQWSDLDIGIFAIDPQRYLTTVDWLRVMGEPLLTFVEPTADGRSQERRVLFADGLDVDFAFMPTAMLQALIGQPPPPDIDQHLRRGVRIVLDKDGLLTQLHADLLTVHSPAAVAPPSAAEFDNVVHDFWYHAVWTAKHLRRGELWWAKGGCDGALKNHLQQMLAWHARATRGAEHDTWFRGRFLEEWIDDRTRAVLPHLFAHYDVDDMWRSLHTLMMLFGEVASETAAQLGYAYPTTGAAFATELVRQLDDERTQLEQADAL